MDLSFRFDWWYRGLKSSPRDAGRVVRCVVRPRGGERLAPASVEVDVDRGVIGDRWETDPHRKPGNQLSLINVHVIDSLCGGDEARAHLAGDNLHVDLDLTEANLPVGTTLTIGAVVLEVSSEPHRPCKSFVARFGATGAKKVARANRVGKRGRGVLTRVLRSGTIHVGDVIHVQRPGRSCL
ncbi:MAG: MOSC domain-containing protein [Planctomycetes bacterium]|nr:MOSC domain-containing protein [Planctomycetota bacterium]